jgi:hypothetical protein
MLSALNDIRRINVVRYLLALILVASTAAAAQAAIINTPGLTHVRIWESTGPFTAYDFVQNGPQMTTQLGVGNLTPSTNDFSPLIDENYDVFYSDANGNFNINGNYVTVEAVFPRPLPAGGGLNLGAVDLIISSLPVRADILASWVGLGNNYIAGSEVLAVDVDNFPFPPTTDTTMGSTITSPTQHLRVTVTWSGFVPEPSTVALGAFGLLGMLVRRKPAVK